LAQACELPSGEDRLRLTVIFSRTASKVVVGVATILIIVAAMPSARRPMLRAAGSLLVVDDPLEESDVIVVPQWTGLSGALDAADLVRNGLATRVAVIGERPSAAEEELMRRHVSYRSGSGAQVEVLQSLGVKHLELIPVTDGGTTAESSLLPVWCRIRQYRRVIVVSSPDHSRRLKRALTRVQGDSPKWIVHSARYASFAPDIWWESREGVRTAVVELQKLLLDFALHPFR
jgi:uncharacterized SAM-binding protein YcdF (DUF218 family)